jgi:alpha-methylacyl-CoA racemase
MHEMRVLDLSRLFPGPYCSRILADFGAEVIRIERPGVGDWMRTLPPMAENGESLQFRALNHGKKSITLNLKSGKGRTILLSLVETADVLLEGFRPGVLDRLGLGHEALRKANPRLVTCSLSGYGPEGLYRNQAGHDLNYQGLAGSLDLTGRRENPPGMPGVLVADVAGGLWAALGILAALLEREQTGRGQQVDCSLLGATLACLPVEVVQHLAGQPLQRGSSKLNGGLVCYNVYEARDGGYMTLAALEPEFWACFCRGVGRRDLLGQQFAPAVQGEPAYDELCALFKTRTREEWAATLAGVDACCEPLYTLGEALASAPVQALKMLGSAGLLPPVGLSAREVQPFERAPALGEHTTAILLEMGYNSIEVERLRREGVV